jgi:hypothetical protein
MRARRIPALLAVVAAASFAGACGSSSTPTSTPTGAPATQAATPTPSISLAPAGVNLTGTWSGQYSGSPYSGNFQLEWTQNGSTLMGGIQLSDPEGSNYSIDGTVTGSSIQFGHVGGVSYTGTVSGSSMSGTWSISGLSGSGGSWSATQTSQVA